VRCAVVALLIICALVVVFECLCLGDGSAVAAWFERPLLARLLLSSDGQPATSDTAPTAEPYRMSVLAAAQLALIMVGSFTLDVLFTAVATFLPGRASVRGVSGSALGAAFAAYPVGEVAAALLTPKLLAHSALDPCAARPMPRPPPPARASRRCRRWSAARRRVSGVGLRACVCARAPLCALSPLTRRTRAAVRRVVGARKTMLGGALVVAIAGVIDEFAVSQPAFLIGVMATRFLQGLVRCPRRSLPPPRRAAARRSLRPPTSLHTTSARVSTATLRFFPRSKARATHCVALHTAFIGDGPTALRWRGTPSTALHGVTAGRLLARRGR
jgi:hypothetical protein